MAWQPSSDQLQQFTRLQELLREWNGRVNLTRLVEERTIGSAKFLTASGRCNLAEQNKPLKVIDVGTGGGFPGLAIAIAMPQAQVTLVDSVGRKVQAVQAMAEALGLADRVKLRCERVEKTGRAPECRHQFQLAVARAVAAAPVGAEYLVPLLSSDGTALLYRGQWSDEDQRQLQRAAAQLNTTTETIQVQELPAQRGCVM